MYNLKNVIISFIKLYLVCQLSICIPIYIGAQNHMQRMISKHDKVMALPSYTGGYWDIAMQPFEIQYQDYHGFWQS